MVGCAVFSCNSRSESQIEGISFHRFPKEAHVRHMWIMFTGREDWAPSNHSKICSKHFEKTCFRKVQRMTYLKEFSVPSLNICNNPPKINIPSISVGISTAAGTIELTPFNRPNTIKPRVMGAKKHVKLKPGCVPSKFNLETHEYTPLPSTSTQDFTEVTDSADEETDSADSEDMKDEIEEIDFKFAVEALPQTDDAVVGPHEVGNNEEVCSTSSLPLLNKETIKEEIIEDLNVDLTGINDSMHQFISDTPTPKREGKLERPIIIEEHNYAVFTSIQNTTQKKVVKKRRKTKRKNIVGVRKKRKTTCNNTLEAQKRLKTTCNNTLKAQKRRKTTCNKTLGAQKIPKATCNNTLGARKSERMKAAAKEREQRIIKTPGYIKGFEHTSISSESLDEVSRLIIARVFRFLQSEFHYMKRVNMKCDLTPLMNILKRTSEATGFSEDIVTACVKEEKQQLTSENNKQRKQARKKDLRTKVVANHPALQMAVKGGVPSANKTNLLLTKIVHNKDAETESSETESETENIAHSYGRARHCDVKGREDRRLKEEEQSENESTHETGQLVLKCEVDENDIEETQDSIEPSSETQPTTTAKRKTARMASAVDPLSSTSAPSVQIIRKVNQMQLEVTPLRTNYTTFGGGIGTIHTHKAKRRKEQQSEPSDEESLSNFKCTEDGLHVVKIEPMDDQ